jgi:hypothetical protein
MGGPTYGSGEEKSQKSCLGPRIARMDPPETVITGKAKDERSLDEQ